MPAFIFQIFVKPQYKFQFWGSYTLTVAPMAANLARNAAGNKLSQAYVAEEVQDLGQVRCRPTRYPGVEVALSQVGLYETLRKTI